jgi:hypothetical protein
VVHEFVAGTNASAYRLCNHLLIGVERKSLAHSQNGAKDPEQELAGQVGQSLIFFECEQ